MSSSSSLLAQSFLRRGLSPPAPKTTPLSAGTRSLGAAPRALLSSRCQSCLVATARGRGPAAPLSPSGKSEQEPVSLKILFCESSSKSRTTSLQPALVPLHQKVVDRSTSEASRRSYSSSCTAPSPSASNSTSTFSFSIVGTRGALPIHQQQYQNKFHQQLQQQQQQYHSGARQHQYHNRRLVFGSTKHIWKVRPGGGSNYIIMSSTLAPSSVGGATRAMSSSSAPTPPKPAVDQQMMESKIMDMARPPNSNSRPAVSSTAPPPPVSYERFCDRLFRQNMFTMKLGLENVQRALMIEGNPHFQHQRVFIGGTNGKGTVGSALSNILTASHQREGRTNKVGFFSSPHIVDFTERFRIDGKPVDRDVVHRVGVEVLWKFGGGWEDFEEALNAYYAQYPPSGGNPFSVGGAAFAGSPAALGSAGSVVPPLDPIPEAGTTATSGVGGGAAAGEKTAFPRVQSADMLQERTPGGGDASSEGGGSSTTDGALFPVLTYFEICTLMGAKIFAHYGVDTAIYEIGLGGRLDAVNALTPPDLCMFATMGFDHQQYLGDTIELISAEKAEIIPVSSGGGAKVVLGPQEYASECEPVFHKYASDRGADMVRPVPGRAVQALQGSGVEFLDKHVVQHLDTAIAAVRSFPQGELFKNKRRNWSMEITDSDIRTGLQNLRWPGRMEDAFVTTEDGRKQHFLLDAAHNADGVRCLGKAVRQRGLNVRAVLFGTMRDKDYQKMVEELQNIVSEDVFVPIHACLIQNKRAADENDYRKFGDLFASIQTSEELLKEVMSSSSSSKDGQEQEGSVLVCGSIFLLGELFPKLQLDAGPVWRERQLPSS